MSSADNSGGWGSGGGGSNPYGSGEPGPPGYPGPYGAEQPARSAYQGFGLYEHGRQPDWAQPGPPGKPPPRSHGPLIALVSLAVVLVLGGVATAVVLNLRDSPTQAAPAPPPATSVPTTTESTTSTTSTADSSDPSERQTFVAPVVAGWQGISWPGFGIAYDVPPSWQPKAGTELGVGDDTTPNHVIVSAASLYMEHYCRDSGSSYRAIAGATTSTDKDTATAATDLIDNWARYGFTSPSGSAPKVSKTTPQQVTLPGNLKATLVSATITPPAGVACSAPTEAISVVAIPSTNGSAMLMALGDQGFSGAVSPQDLRKIVTSLRRTG